MKTLLLFLCLALSSICFVLGQDQYTHTQERTLITGGFEEIDISLCDPELLDYIRQVTETMAETTIEETELPEEEDKNTGAEVIKIFRQIVQGYKYIVCAKLADNTLALFVIHNDLSGEFLLLESYKDIEIFDFFSRFLSKNENYDALLLLY